MLPPAQVVDNAKMLLTEEARKNKIEYIGLVYKDNLDQILIKTLINLSVPIGVLLQFVVSNSFFSIRHLLQC